MSSTPTTAATMADAFYVLEQRAVKAEAKISKAEAAEAAAKKRLSDWEKAYAAEPSNVIEVYGARVFRHPENGPSIVAAGRVIVVASHVTSVARATGEIFGTEGLENGAYDLATEQGREVDDVHVLDITLAGGERLICGLDGDEYKRLQIELGKVRK